MYSYKDYLNRMIELDEEKKKEKTKFFNSVMDTLEESLKKIGFVKHPKKKDVYILGDVYLYLTNRERFNKLNSNVVEFSINDSSNVIYMTDRAISFKMGSDISEFIKEVSNKTEKINVAQRRMDNMKDKLLKKGFEVKDRYDDKSYDLKFGSFLFSLAYQGRVLITIQIDNPLLSKYLIRNQMILSDRLKIGKLIGTRVGSKKITDLLKSSDFIKNLKEDNKLIDDLLIEDKFGL